MTFITGLFRVLVDLLFYSACFATVALIGLSFAGILQLPESTLDNTAFTIVGLLTLYLLKQTLDRAATKRTERRLEELLHQVVQQMVDQPDERNTLELNLLNTRLRSLRAADAEALAELVRIEQVIKCYEASPLRNQVRTEIEVRLTAAKRRLDVIDVEMAENQIDTAAISAAVNILSNRLEEEDEGAEVLEEALDNLADLEQRLAAIPAADLDVTDVQTRLRNLKQRIDHINQLNHPFGAREDDLEDTVASLETEFEELEYLELVEKIERISEINTKLKKLINSMRRSFELLEQIELAPAE